MTPSFADTGSDRPSRPPGADPPARVRPTTSNAAQPRVCNAAWAASSKEVSGNGSSSRIRLLRATVGLRSPSIRGAGHLGVRRFAVQTSDAASRRRGAGSALAPRRSAAGGHGGGDPLDHLPVGHDLGATGVERAPERLLPAADRRGSDLSTRRSAASALRPSGG